MTDLTPATDFPARCRAIRTHFGLSARAMSIHLGIAQNNWFQYELGRKEPGMTTLRSLAALGLNVDWLVAGRGPMFINERAPTPSGAGNSFARILKALELVLREHDAERFALWSRIVTTLHQSLEGVPLETIARQAGVPASDPRLLEQLAWLQKEGVVGFGNERYRLIRSSYALEASGAELQGLLSVRDLLGTMIPAFRDGVGRGLLIRFAETPAGGTTMEQLSELVRLVRRLSSESLAPPGPAGSKTFQLVFAFLVND